MVKAIECLEALRKVRQELLALKKHAPIHVSNVCLDELNEIIERLERRVDLTDRVE